MKKKLKWIIVNSCLFQLSLAFANTSVAEGSRAASSAKDPLYSNFMFDSAKLLQMNREPSLAVNGATTESNQTPANGFFLYKLQATDSHLSLPSNPFAVNINAQPQSSFYGHLFQRLMQHLFVDLAGGYEPTADSTSRFSPNVELNKYGYTNNYSKNWFASASALFTHTWKEFAFNAHLGLTHAEANQDPYALYFASTTPTEFGSPAQNKVSFIHENAELSYRANSLVQPFVGGGLLQVVNLNNDTQLPLNLTLPGSLTDASLDSNGYKIGGGLSLNYKQYVLRLEQQYYQIGNMYRNNQSTLSFKVNLG